MKKTTKALAASAIAVAAIVGLAGCESDAVVSSRNITTAADNFEVQRAIAVVNGITTDTIFYAEGRCSVEREGRDLLVLCKHGPDDYRKHIVMMGDQDSVAVTQLEGIDVSVYHTRIILKPENILPDFDLSVGVQ